MWLVMDVDGSKVDVLSSKEDEFSKSEGREEISAFCAGKSCENSSVDDFPHPIRIKIRLTAKISAVIFFIHDILLFLIHYSI